MSYDLEHVKVPRLAGFGLSAFTRLIEGPLRGLLMPKLLKDGGITRFRSLEPEEAPTVFPLGAVDAAAVEAARPADLPSENAVPRGTQRGFVFSSSLDFARAYREGSSTPETVAARVLEAIEKSESRIVPMRAMIKWNVDDLQAQARESAERIRSGRARSVLEGVPVAVKDELDQVPYTTSVGTRFLGTSPARSDAGPVARLRSLGALLIGKSNMYEIGISPTGNNPHFGFARNPYGDGHDTGGSSSGSGAAVGMGLCPIAVGADGGGSIRIPAALCGGFGLKATFGRVSESGAAPLCWSVAHVGPLAATAADLLLGYLAVAGPDERDPMSQHQPMPTAPARTPENLNHVVIGVFEDWFADATPDVVAANREMLERLKRRGARVKEIRIPGLESMRAAHAVTILSEMAAAMEVHYKTHRKDFGLGTRVNLMLAKQFTNLDYLRAQRIRTRALATFDEVFREVNVIATPATGRTAPPIRKDSIPRGESDLSVITDLMRFIIPGNLCGLPGLSVPVGYDGSGLPIAMHLAAAHWQESLLLELALVSEGEVERREPQVHYRLLG